MKSKNSFSPIFCKTYCILGKEKKRSK